MLRSAIFIGDIFHINAEASSVIFNLCPQFFATTKMFELERLHVHFCISLNDLTVVSSLQMMKKIVKKE